MSMMEGFGPLPRLTDGTIMTGHNEREPMFDILIRQLARQRRVADTGGRRQLRAVIAMHTLVGRSAGH